MKDQGIKYSCQRNTLNKTRRYKTGHHMRKESDSTMRREWILLGLMGEERPERVT